MKDLTAQMAKPTYTATNWKLNMQNMAAKGSHLKNLLAFACRHYTVNKAGIHETFVVSSKTIHSLIVKEAACAVFTSFKRDRKI